MYGRKSIHLLIVATSCSVAFGQSESQERSRSVKPKGCETASTQLEMNQCSAAEAKDAEAELNRLYQQLLARTSNPVYRRKIEAAQKAWLAYRDAELEAKYPAEDKRAEYGSVYPMCTANDQTDLTRARIEEIKTLLNSSEGDMCAGEWAREK